jgi:DNA polymerase III epsilon subunit-like protein
MKVQVLNESQKYEAIFMNLSDLMCAGLIAAEFSVVQKEVADLIADRILVGHAVKNDLKVISMKYKNHLV